MPWFYNKLTNLPISWILRKLKLLKGISLFTRRSKTMTLTLLRLKLKFKTKGGMKVIRLRLPLLTAMMMDNRQVAPTARRASVVKELKSIVRIWMKITHNGLQRSTLRSATLILMKQALEALS